MNFVLLYTDTEIFSILFPFHCLKRQHVKYFYNILLIKQKENENIKQMISMTVQICHLCTKCTMYISISLPTKLLVCFLTYIVILTNYKRGQVLLLWSLWKHKEHLFFLCSFSANFIRVLLE